MSEGQTRPGRDPDDLPAVPGAMPPSEARDLVMRWYNRAQRLQQDPDAFSRWQALDLLDVEVERYLRGGRREDSPPSEIDRSFDPMLYPLAEMVALWAAERIEKERREREGS